MALTIEKLMSALSSSERRPRPAGSAQARMVLVTRRNTAINELIANWAEVVRVVGDIKKLTASAILVRAQSRNPTPVVWRELVNLQVFNDMIQQIDDSADNSITYDDVEYPA